MGCKALTIDKQINLLKERGLIIPNEEKAKEILLDIGYYRLGFYWYHFQDKRTHKFEQNIQLDDIVTLYYFDSDLKNLLSKYIYRIEVHFRTQVVYYISNHYQGNPKWFFDPEIVNNSVLKELHNIYSNIKKNKILNKHHNKYPHDNYAPAWKTFEFLTFGQVYKIYLNLKDEDLKKNIAQKYEVREYKLLDNYFRSIINIRNICSHNAILYDYKQPKGIKKIPCKKYRNIGRDSYGINASLKLILFILSKISINRANDLENNLKDLFNNFDTNQLTRRILSDIVRYDL